MARHRSHAAKTHPASHDAHRHTATIIPPSSTPPVEPKKEEKEYIPPFLAWPSYLFERMLSPWRNVTSVMSQVDSWRVGNRIVIPKSQSKETDKAYHYLIDLPGIKRDQIELNFHNGTIMLRVETSERSRHYWRSHSIRRAFTLPVYTDAAAITAHLKDGVLTIAIPKTDWPVSSKSRTIEIA